MARFPWPIFSSVGAGIYWASSGSLGMRAFSSPNVSNKAAAWPGLLTGRGLATLLVSNWGGIGIGGRSVGTQESIRALRNAYSSMDQILGRTKKSCHELGTVTSEHATLVTDTLRIRVFSRRLATIRLILHGFANSVMADLPTSGGGLH